MKFKTDDNSINLAKSLAKNPITHKEALHTLSHYPHPDVRELVAIHNNTHQDTLHKLSDDPDKYVRWGVAEHNNTHKDTLHKLSSDPDSSVRRAAKLRLAELKG